MLLADAAIERLVLGVRMDVDETGKHCPAVAVNEPLRGAGVIGSEVDNAVAAKGQIDIAAIGVPAVLDVPGDDPVSVLDQRGLHRAPLDIGSWPERLLCHTGNDNGIARRLIPDTARWVGPPGIGGHGRLAALRWVSCLVARPVSRRSISGA